jgi:hypothetical protein
LRLLGQPGLLSFFTQIFELNQNIPMVNAPVILESQEALTRELRAQAAVQDALLVRTGP